ncbi:hypothetical protein ACFX2I_035768 [Malus domestica]
MENQGSSICFHGFLELRIASLRMKVLDLLIFDSASPLLYLTLLFSLLLFLSYFFSLTPDSLFLKTSLSISPKVPSVLHQHAVALGSCPKFRILSPDEIKISVWNHTVNSFVVGGNGYLLILGFRFGSLQTLSGSGV